MKLVRYIGLGLASVLLLGIIAWGAASVYTPPGVPILNYHRVDNKSEDRLTLTVADFDAQMAYLHSRGYRTIKPDQLLDYLQGAGPLPDKAVVITFDDGYEDNYTNAWPILQKYNYTAAVFLITDKIGADSGYMTWEQAEAMRKPGGSIENGWIIGSHTLDHGVLTKLSPAEVRFQLEKSKEGMQWRLDVPVKYFAYPTGAYNQTVRDMVQQAGYKAAFATDFGRATRDSDVYALPRIPILKSYVSFCDFYLRLHFTPAIGQLKRVKDKIFPPKEQSLYT